MLEDKIADYNQELQNVTFARGLGRVTDIEVGPDGYMYVLSNYMHKADNLQDRSSKPLTHNDIPLILQEISELHLGGLRQTLLALLFSFL